MVWGILSLTNGYSPAGMMYTVFGFIGIVCAVFIAYSAARTIRFYEFAAESSLPVFPPKIISYADLQQLVYHTTRQYLNGAYIGTKFFFEIRSNDHRRIRYYGVYHNKARWWKPSFMSEKEGDYVPTEESSQLETVRDLIASRMSQPLLETLAAQGSVDWGSKLKLTTEGVIPRSGKYKQQLVRFDKVDSIFFNNGYLHFIRRGDRKSFTNVSISEPNFWPLLQVLQSLYQVRIEQELEDGNVDPRVEEEAVTS